MGGDSRSRYARHRKGRRATLDARVQKVQDSRGHQGPAIADPLETAISAPAPDSARAQEPLNTRNTREILKSFLL